jgi:hypothetical protein
MSGRARIARMSDPSGTNLPFDLRQRLRFRLSTLVLMVGLAAVFLGIYSWGLRRARRQAPAAATLREMGAKVVYDMGGKRVETSGDLPPDIGSQSPYPAWLVRRLGIDFFHNVAEVHYQSSRQSADEEIDRFWFAIGQLPRLERLETSWGITRPGSIRVLARHTRLQSLSLRWANPAAEDYAVIEYLESLEHLNLSETPVNDEGVSWIARSDSLASLDLHHANITDAGVRRLSKMPQLTRLWLSGIGVGDAGIVSLREHPSLVELDLCGTQITDASLAHVASIPRLEGLDVARTAITDQGLAQLAGHTSLAYLNLEHTEIDGTGLAVVRELPGLRDLCLGNPHRKVDLVELAGCRHLEQIKLSYQVPSPEIAELDFPQVILLAGHAVPYASSSLDIRDVADAELARLSKIPSLKAVELSDLSLARPAAIDAFKLNLPNCELRAVKGPPVRGLRNRP